MIRLHQITLLLIVFSLFSGMTVVYRDSNGEIVAIGPFSEYKLKDGQSSLEVPDADPNQIKTHIVAQGFYREKNSAEKAAESTAKEQSESAEKSNADALKSKLKLSDAELVTLRKLLQGG